MGRARTRWLMLSKSMATLTGSLSLSSFFLFIFILVVLGGIAAGSFGVLLLGFGFFLVAFRRERRRKIFAKHDDVHAASDVAAVGRHVDAAESGSHVRARREVEILPVFIEDGKLSVAQSVG